MGRKCITRGFKLKNMSSERTKVFSLLFAFQGKPRKTLGYKNDKAGLKLKAECI
jgi:hypothetical protein